MKINQDLSQMCQSQTKCPDDQLVVNAPKKSKIYATEMEDDECWLWACFVPPGTH